MNLIEHIVPDRRRNKPHSASSSFEEQQKNNMVHEPKKIDTGLLVGKKIH